MCKQKSFLDFYCVTCVFFCANVNKGTILIGEENYGTEENNITFNIYRYNMYDCRHL